MNLKITYRKDKFEPTEQLKKDGIKPLIYDSSQSYEVFYAQVYQQMFQILFAYGMQICGNKDLVKDTIQELFSEFWKNQKILKKVQSMKSYLFKCLKRKLMRELGKRKKLVVEGGFEFVASHEVKLIQDQLDLDNKKALHKALNSLTYRQREAIFLKFYGNFSYSEVADVLKINTKSAYDLVYRSLMALKLVMTPSS